jgi:Ca2+-binding RTX toxin-like protein
MSLSPTRLMAGEVPYSPTESICIIFKETDSISNVMQREISFARKNADNKGKTTNSIMTTKALALTVTTVLLLSLPALGVVSVWAANFVGTSGPDTIVGTDDDDKIFGKNGNDILRGEGGDDYIKGNAGDDAIHDGPGRDKVWGGSGDDRIGLCGVDEECVFGGDIAWGGSGDDNIGQSSECPGNHAFGGPGNDRITTVPFVKGGSGNDFISFNDCGGVAFGGSGDDEIIGGDNFAELHGGKGNDILRGGGGANHFDCGPGTDTITNFSAAEDTKTSDCENVLEKSVSTLDNSNDNNANTTETDTTPTSTPSSGVAEDSPATEEEAASSLPGTTTTAPSSNNSTETTEATGTAEIQKTMEVLPDEELGQQEQQMGK